VVVVVIIIGIVVVVDDDDVVVVGSVVAVGVVVVVVDVVLLLLLSLPLSLFDQIQPVGARSDSRGQVSSDTNPVQQQQTKNIRHGI